jgi:SAM-dependent methyltransferase
VASFPDVRVLLTPVTWQCGLPLAHPSRRTTNGDILRRVLTQLQYRLLKYLAPGGPSGVTSAAYAGRSKLRVLLGDALIDSLRGQRVLDFGCGLGDESLELTAIAAHVYGLDILPRYLAEAQRKANAAGLADRVTFDAAPPREPVDTIVSLDSFEHFSDPAGVLRQMYDLLRPGGRVVASFGPTWYHPFGGHLFSVVPWAHVVFSEQALIRWRNDIRSDGATRFSNVEGGLNQMTIRRFERLVRASPFRLVTLESVPIHASRRFHSRLTCEFTTAIVRCVLERHEAAPGG